MICMVKNALILAAGIPIMLGMALAVGILFAGAFMIVFGRRIFSFRRA